VITQQGENCARVCLCLCLCECLDFVDEACEGAAELACVCVVYVYMCIFSEYIYLFHPHKNTTHTHIRINTIGALLVSQGTSSGIDSRPSQGQLEGNACVCVCVFDIISITFIYIYI
jgi:hypothetical protein